MRESIPHSHCHFCGTPYPPEQRGNIELQCSECGRFSYKNPLPAAVLLVPTKAGLYMTRRGIEPGNGLLCLPGGHIEAGETWRATCARETEEEMQVIIPDPERDIAHYATEHNPERTYVIVFGIVRRGVRIDERPFMENREATERLVVRPNDIPKDFAFPLHEEIVRRYFSEHIC